MIIGADESTDATILKVSSELYAGYRMRRVYFSAFSPIPDASSALPLKPPPLIREHRLYQADWLLRFYGFNAQEITDSSTNAGMLPLDIDPKLAWALNHREVFPIDLNRAPREMLLRIPGLGTKTVKQVLQIRRWQKVRLRDLIMLRASVKKALPFIICADHHPGTSDPATAALRSQLARPTLQQSLVFE